MRIATGVTFDRLTVTSDDGARSVSCICVCGNTTVVDRANLRSGRTRSCGCLRAERNASRAEAVVARFWAKVQRGPEADDCWPWQGSLDEKGYGRFHDGKRLRKAHAVAFEHTHGPIPDGLEPDHLCHDADRCRAGNQCPHRRCCNPLHLELVTHRENCQRSAYAKDACAHGHPLPLPGANGRRVCRPCANQRNREYRARKALYEAVMA
jgi:hypothetical protein